MSEKKVQNQIFMKTGERTAQKDWSQGKNTTAPAFLDLGT